jgi:hypothetical protein
MRAFSRIRALLLLCALAAPAAALKQVSFFAPCYSVAAAILLATQELLTKRF